MLNKINKEKVKEIKLINKDQNELCKFILKDQKVKKEIKEAIKDTINNTDSIYALDNLSLNRVLLYNTIPTYKKSKDKELTNYEKLYIEILKIIKEYIGNDNYRFMFQNQYHDRTIYNLIENLSDIITRFSYEDIKNILKKIKESNGERINQTQTFLRLCNYVHIEEANSNNALINKINIIKEENKQILVNKVLRDFYAFNVESNAKRFAFRILDDIKDSKDENELKIMDRFLDIIYERGYLLENNNFKIHLFREILDVIEKEYNNQNINMYLDLLNEYNFINSKELDYVEKNKILKGLLNIEIKEENKELLFNYIKKVILQCKDEELRNYFINKIEIIKYNKSYEWLMEFYPIIIKYGNIAYKKGYIDELSNIYDNLGENDTVQKRLTIQMDYTKGDLK